MHDINYKVLSFHVHQIVFLLATQIMYWVVLLDIHAILYDTLNLPRAIFAVGIEIYSVPGKLFQALASLDNVIYNRSKLH